MTDLVIARALHVLGVVLWIGGVAMVTTVLLPAARDFSAPGERLAFFERIEGRFARQARWTTLLTGLSGFYMLHVLHAWGRYAQPAYWWVHAMTAVWLLFTLMLFVLEPFFLHRWFHARAARDPLGTFALIQRLHWVLLSVSLITILGAMIGVHGGWLFR
ncbi:MAG: hypothetical protein ACOY5C_04100 [Pseudomonadota bacterium]|uniref:membrane protein n=1 Tax=Thermithiobacillus tepidarius TaxID=929 RepID=UPI0003FC09BD|nr:membrane protein [Thermithiobacillus tepidarius]